ncbi:MAG: EcsC protein family [Paenibacillus sp.]|nr:EcsC protein family [Paenibacillus sp.]
MFQFNDYEAGVIQEIAGNEEKPNPVKVALELAGKPVSKVLDIAHRSDNKYVRKAVNSIDATIEKSLKKTIKAANLLTGDDAVRKEYKKKWNIELKDIEDIRKLSLHQMDKVADSFDVSNAFIVATEGAVMGAATTLLEAVPFAQVAIPSVVIADVAASMTIMSRHICQISTSYGYSSGDLTNVPHILSAMAPSATSMDESFLVTKAAAINEIRETVKFAAKHAGDLTKQLTKETAYPQLIHLVRMISGRLGIVITEKELGMLIPIAGAVLNGGLNLAFQQMNHTNAKDYFRRLYLYDKYGESMVNEAIETEKRKLRNHIG